MTSRAETANGPRAPIEPGRLRALNLGAGVAHLVQALVILVLSTDLSLPVSAAFPNAQPGRPLDPDQLETLFSYRLGPAVALFSLLSALFHFLVASPWGWPRYLRELSAGRNRFRWVEYSLSASLMIVLIAGITGITDVTALIALFTVNASMILFGWLMETTNEASRDLDWTPFIFGSIAGAIPWVAIGIYLIGAGSSVPNFVYGIYVTLFLAFNCFAITQLLQYRARGRWADYLFGERTYIVLSFVAKSLLAWQVFANVLVG
ncbi:MAG: heliorhodopsin HeR [Aquihabitans sp.]